MVDLQQKVGQLISRFKRLHFGYTFPFKINNNSDALLWSLVEILFLNGPKKKEGYKLKNICQVEHSRHRSMANYFNNIFSALIAYNFKDKKPSLKDNFLDTKQLILL